MENTKAPEVTENELQQINRHLSELHNHAVDIRLRAVQFNDRVQGSIPEPEHAEGAQSQPDSLLNAIHETISYLRSSLKNIDEEVSRLSNIG